MPLRRRSFNAMLSVIGTWLSGCAIGTPWPRIEHGPEASSQQPFVLVLTRVVVEGRKRDEFERQNRRVLASMSAHPGLIGYAARREIFGTQGWTMSIWVDDEARARFVNSSVNREAMQQALPSLLTFDTRRLTVARQDLPQDWEQAQALLAHPDRRRNYRE